MEIMGIKFAPMNTPIERRLQTLAAGLWFVTIALGGFVGLFIAFYLLIFTDYWFGILMYLIWAWVIDNDTCERGGRPIQWVRKLSWWTYMKAYFPMRLEKVPGVELDPKRNYLFCSFPHGILATGGFLGWATDAGGFNELFPKHTPHLLTLKQHFNKPYFRELLYSLGICSASAESINWLLKYPGGGKAPLLVVGGVAEAFYCKPGQYHLVLKNRKGFIKLAIENGSALVPVVSFGETDLFDQVDHPYIRTFQIIVKKLSGVAPIIPLGRGFLQYTFGWVPQRKPIVTIIGKPMEVEKIDSPTKEHINDVHAKFVQYLIEFFNEQKYNYVENPEETELVID